MASYLQTCNSISVRLDDTNYPTWVFLMQHFLRSRGLLKFVDGSFSDSKTTASESWFERDSAVITLIAASLSEEALTLVIGCQTSMEVWSTLKQHYAPNSEFHIMKLESTMHNFRKGSDSIDKYLLCFKDVQNQLDVIGNRVSDDDLKTLILAGLPCEYAHTRQIIRSKDHVSMEEVRSLLLSGEYEVGLKQETFSMFHSPTKTTQTCLVDHSFQNGSFDMSKTTLSQGMSSSGYTNWIVSSMHGSPSLTNGMSSCLGTPHGLSQKHGLFMSPYVNMCAQFNLQDNSSQIGGFSHKLHLSEANLQSSENGFSNYKNPGNTKVKRVDESEMARTKASASSSIEDTGKIQTCTTNQYVSTLPCSTRPKALSATIGSHSKPCSKITQPEISAYQSQVTPLNHVHASSSLSSISVEKGIALQTSSKWLQSSSQHKSSLICRQAYMPMNIGKCLPLIPPG